MQIFKISFLLCLGLLVSCDSNKQSNTDSLKVKGKIQDISIVTTFDQLNQFYNLNSDTTYIINFWATWCKPCVAELPYFNKTAKDFEGKKIKFVFVSLDFINTIEKNVKPFLAKNPLNGKVIILGDQDVNTWGSEIDNKWDGAIPVTMLLNKNKKASRLGSFQNENDLKRFINLNLPTN